MAEAHSMEIDSTAPEGGGEYRDSVIRRKARTSEHLTLEWRDLFYAVQVGKKEEKKQLVVLNHVSGKAESGQLVAILGPSGSGKTSLLNALAARVPLSRNAVLTGTVLHNGRPRDDSQWKNISAYLQQDDILFAHLTVRETLMLSANFYLPSSISAAKKTEMVDGIIFELGLAKAQNTIVGNEVVPGVSGGERKRANVGVDLISDPSVLFLDEPTSGLDSFQAQSVMSAMRTLAHNGRLVVSVIHQPRSSIFAMFDQLLLISEGRIIYYGRADDAIAYFEGANQSCPPHFNPADFFLDVLSMDYRTAEAEAITHKRIHELGDMWLATYTVDTQEPGRSLSVSTPNANSSGKPVQELKENAFRSSWLTQFYLLWWRAFIEMRRNNLAITLQLFQSVFFALVLSAIYHNVGHDQASIQSRKGLLFFVAINQCFRPLLSVIISFPVERKIINRERASKTYHVSAYYLAKAVAELPINALAPIIFGTILYWAVGLNPLASRFGLFLLAVVLEAQCAVAMGLFISALSPSVTAAIALGPPVVIVLILFGGFFINVSSLPTGSRWVPNVSLMYWTFIALSVNEFKGEHFTCATDEPVCLHSGEDVLKTLAFTKFSTGDGLLGLVLILIAWNVLAYAALRVNRQKYLLLTQPKPSSTSDTNPNLTPQC